MKEHFVSYEVALLMKSMGFDEPCIGYWKTRDWLVEEKTRTDGYTHADQECSAPLKSQFFKWVRDKFGICPNIEDEKKENGVYRFSYGVWGYTCSSYEQAEESLINKIIEIIKLK